MTHHRDLRVPRKALACLMVLALWMAMAPPVSATEHEATVFGTVTDAETGEPIEGATVAVGQFDQIYTGTSDSDGNYQVDGIEPGVYNVVADARRYALSTDRIQLEDAETREIDFPLQPREPVDHGIGYFEGNDEDVDEGTVGPACFEATHSIYGLRGEGTYHGFDAQDDLVVFNGEVAAGEEVHAAGPLQLEIEATETYYHGPEGTHGTDALDACSVPAGAEVPAEFRLFADGQVHDGAGGPCVGEGTFWRDGDPFEASWTLTSDCVVEGNEAGTPGSGVAPAGTEQILQGVHEPCFDPGEDWCPDNIRGDFGQSMPSGTVTGTVTDDTGAPIEGATVSGGGREVTTAADGSYELIGLAEASHDVTADADGYEAATTSDVAVQVDATTRVDFALAAAPGAIAGTVTDADSGDPVEGATVSAGGQEATTGADGTYEIAGLDAGSYSVTAEVDGYQTATKDDSVVEAGATTTVDFALAAAPGAIAGTVTDADSGDPIEGAIVSAGGQEATTGADGSYEISGLEAGTYSVTAEADGYVAVTADDISVEPGETTPLDFVLEAASGAIAGTVTDADSTDPIEGATVSADGQEVTTGTDGIYEIGGLDAGTYSVTAEADGYVTATEDDVVVEAGATTTVDFALAAAPGAIAGTVTDEGSGEPIEGATVSADGQEATTGADGSYEISGLEAGTYSVTAEADGYVAVTADDISVEPGETTPLDFVLETASGAIAGTVTDADSGDPVEGATVSADGQEATTGTDGSYEISGLEAGTYSVTAEADGYQTATEDEVVVEAGATTTVGFALADAPGAIAGTVTDADSGDPVEGASVSADGQEATTGSDGTYEIGGLDAGSYSVTAEADGYVTATEDEVVVEAGATTTVDFALADAPGAIAGTVTDADSTDPIEGATVSADGQEATTGADGSYEIGGLDAGTHSVTAEADGYVTATEDDVVVEAGATTTVDFVLVAEPTTGAIAGTVTDADSGDPVEGATVSADGQEARTNSDGDYTIGGLDAGDYTVTANADGYEEASQDATVDVGATTTVDFALVAEPTTGAIAGTVTDEDSGQPIEGTTVSADGQEATTSSDGSYEISGLDAGTYSVTADADGYVAVTADNISVEPGETTPLDFVLELEVGSIAGTVTDADSGDPIEGVTVSVDGEEATTNADGDYTIEDLEVGTYSVTAEADGYQTATEDDVEVVADQTTTVDFELEAEADLPSPDNKRDCMRGGWRDYEFENQGQCIRYVETGKDDRTESDETEQDTVVVVASVAVALGSLGEAVSSLLDSLLQSLQALLVDLT